MKKIITSIICCFMVLLTGVLFVGCSIGNDNKVIENAQLDEVTTKTILSDAVANSIGQQKWLAKSQTYTYDNGLVVGDKFTNQSEVGAEIVNGKTVGYVKYGSDDKKLSYIVNVDGKTYVLNKADKKYTDYNGELAGLGNTPLMLIGCDYSATKEGDKVTICATNKASDVSDGLQQLIIEIKDNRVVAIRTFIYASAGEKLQVIKSETTITYNDKAVFSVTIPTSLQGYTKA